MSRTVNPLNRELYEVLEALVEQFDAACGNKDTFEQLRLSGEIEALCMSQIRTVLAHLKPRERCAGCGKCVDTWDNCTCERCNCSTCLAKRGGRP